MFFRIIKITYIFLNNKIFSKILYHLFGIHEICDMKNVQTGQIEMCTETEVSADIENY